MEEEYFFTCPYCGERISVFLDMAAETGQFVEDCEVCCNPIEVAYQVEDGKITAFEARKTDE